MKGQVPGKKMEMDFVILNAFALIQIIFRKLVKNVMLIMGHFPCPS